MKIMTHEELNSASSTSSALWTDDESGLLLSVTLDYKTENELIGINWESIKSKYKDIHERFLSKIPSEQEAEEMGRDFGNASCITKLQLTNKLKHVNRNFRKAVDKGKKSGYGRVVWLFFDVCTQIWGDCPTVTQIENGLETEDVAIVPDADNVTNANMDNLDASIVVTNDVVVTDENSQLAYNERRNLLNKSLSGYKENNLKRKIPQQKQMLNVAKEDLEIKKQLLETIQSSETKHQENVRSMIGQMEKQTQMMMDGFSLLRELLAPPPTTTSVPPLYQTPVILRQQHGNQEDAEHFQTIDMDYLSQLLNK